MSEREPKPRKSEEASEEIREMWKYNNFMRDLPGGGFREDPPTFVNLDITMEQDLLEKGKTAGREERYKKSLNSHSEKRRGQTRREFWDAIDSTIDELGQDIGKIESLGKEMDQLKQMGDSDAKLTEEQNQGRLARIKEVSRELYEETEGLYEKLIESGYNHVDLSRGE